MGLKRQNLLQLQEVIKNGKKKKKKKKNKQKKNKQKTSAETTGASLVKELIVINELKPS